MVGNDIVKELKGAIRNHQRNDTQLKFIIQDPVIISSCLFFYATYDLHLFSVLSNVVVVIIILSSFIP